MWKIGEMIGSREGRMDICVANAGILKSHTDCLEYPEREFRGVCLLSSEKKGLADYQIIIPYILSGH